jgi:hypothetical protein
VLGVIDDIGIGQLVHHENLRILLIPKVLQLQDYKNFDAQVGVHVREWVHMWFQCNIHYVINYNIG